MAIVRNHRQTVLDHDPKTGEIVGATKIFERRVIENDIDQGKLNNETEAVDLKDVPKLWGGTSDRHVAAMAKAEESIQAERDAWAKEREEFLAQVAGLEADVGLLRGERDDLKGRLQAVAKSVAILAQIANV